MEEKLEEKEEKDSEKLVLKDLENQPKKLS